MGIPFSKGPKTAGEDHSKRKRPRSSDDVPELSKHPRLQAESSGLSALAVDYAIPSNSPNDALALEAKTRRKKRKVALILAYNGAAYHGMQYNPSVVTIESQLLDALHQSGLVRSSGSETLRESHWNRAARTDKGVSAACQCVSLRIACEVNGKIDNTIVDSVNSNLPNDIRLIGIQRATKSFNARTDCNRRLYEYLFPVQILGGGNGAELSAGEKAGDPRIERLNKILERYVGTHCFANFTEGLKGTDDTAKRYMIRVEASEPFQIGKAELYFSSIELYGQSFVLYQIRKMCGLAFAILNGILPVETIDVALSPHVRFTVPTAPSLGLLLSSLDLSQHRLPCFLDDAMLLAKNSFKFEMIYPHIAKEEAVSQSMLKWLQTLRASPRYSASRIKMDYEKYVAGTAGIEEERRRKLSSQFPVTTDIIEFFGRCSSRSSKEASDEEAELKLRLHSFEEKFGLPAKTVVRVPGRVNLIGEHCDYNTFPVIGVATRQGTLVFGTQTNDLYVRVAHVEEPLLGGGMMAADGKILDEVDQDKGGMTSNSDWIRYLSWGWSAALDSAFPSKKSIPKYGARILVSGDLPRAAGLGSSSSLVTAGALIAARMNRRKFEREEVALIAAEGERIGAGTRGGAVDHTVSMCGVKGSAVYVSFSPQLQTLKLALPMHASFVIVNSGVSAFKGQSDITRKLFNMRVAECRIASALAARRLNTHLGMTVSTPGQLYNMARAGSQVTCVREMKEHVARILPPDEDISLEAAIAEIGLSEIEIKNRFCQGLDVGDTRLKVGRRIMHVLSEAERVERFRDLLSKVNCKNNQSNAGGLSEYEVIVELGKLLSQSHHSLRDLYECSCKEVDDLVEYCIAQGSVGSRITGAGWGGCILNLVFVDRLEKFVSLLELKLGRNAVFVVEPNNGACVLAVE